MYATFENITLIRHECLIPSKVIVLLTRGVHMILEVITSHLFVSKVGFLLVQNSKNKTIF